MFQVITWAENIVIFARKTPSLNLAFDESW